MQRILLLILVLALSIECSFHEPAIDNMVLNNDSKIKKMPSEIESYTRYKSQAIIQQVNNRKDLSPGEAIVLISSKFTDIPHKNNRLKCIKSNIEELIIDFRQMDCFSYLDYIKALQLSISPDEFIHNVIKVRYINSYISFYNRRHFFTDWATRRYRLANDMTSKLSDNTLTIKKTLNKKENGEYYFPDLPCIQRDITYIPGQFIDNQLLKKMQPGDFIGVYNPRAGQDVSYVGIYVPTDNGPMFRHLSTAAGMRRVVDTPFLASLSQTPGIIILRSQ